MKKIILIFLLGSFALNAQITGKLDTKELLEDEISSSMSNPELLKSSEIPVGNEINPDFYYPGPGDVFMVKVLPIITKEQLIVVSPDNRMMLPRAGGMIDVSGKNITQIRKEIDSIYKTFKDVADANVSFYKSKVCLVNVDGNVENQKTYSVPSTYKVSTVINLANEPSKDRTSLKSDDYFIQKRLRRKKEFDYLGGVNSQAKSNYWRRNVILIRQDGSSQIVDLDKAMVSNSDSLDPYVKPGDKIIVPFSRNDLSFISISGAVIRPYTTVFKSEDMLSELLKMGMGLLPNADMNNIYLFNSGNKTKIRIDNNLNLLSDDIKLSPGSRIIVGSKAENKSDKYGVVSVKGYVQSEGSYPIIEGETTLSQILNEAGGLMEEAYLPLAHIKRLDADLLQMSESRTEALKLFRKSDLTFEDTTRYLLDIYSLESRVSVDFEKALNSSDYDVKLQDGDEIIVPTNPNKVYIFGRVNEPGFIDFQEGKTIDWYVNKTGGVTEEADDSRIALIRSNTSKWINDEEAIVQDGDYIYIPGEKDIPLQAEQAQYGSIAAIAGAIASIGFFVISVINSFNN